MDAVMLRQLADQVDHGPATVVGPAAPNKRQAG